MSSIHYGLTLSARVKTQQMEVLANILHELQDDFQYNHPSFSPKNLTTTHFITWVIVPEEVAPNGKTLPSRLLMMTSYTGSKKQHMKELVQVGLKGLHEVYQHCEEYPCPDLPSGKEMLTFLKRVSIKNTYYTGFQYVTPELAAKQNQLRLAIEDYLSSGDFNRLSPAQVRGKIQEHVRSISDLSWAHKPYKRSFKDFVELYGALILFVTLLGGSLILGVFHIFLHHPVTLAGLIVFSSFIGFVGLLLVLLRLDESIPYQAIEPASDERIHEITSKEFHQVKNEMTVIAPLKKGFIRPFFLAFTLRLVPIFRAFSYIPSVHTARWLQTDKGKRLVFIAYFDNTSEGYAHDFVDSTKRTRNLNLIFGHASGFPATKWAVGGGGKNRKGYITGVRAYQRITNFWYTTFPQLSILNMVNNQEIHKGLFNKLDDKEIKEWLLRL